MKVINISSLRNEHFEIEAQAREWAVRLDGEELGISQRTELEEWLKRSPLHKELFKKAVELWMSTDVLHALLEGNRVDGAHSSYRQQRNLSGCFTIRFVSLAVMAMLFSVVSYNLIFKFLDTGNSIDAEYATALGEIKSVSLPDGSSVSLNTSTRVSVSYNRDVRFVHLSSGEAFFEVAHDSEKPFMVYVGKYAVKAVGTAFSIRVYEDIVDVIVTDGRIEVSSFELPITDSSQLNLEFLENSESMSLVPLNKGQMGIFNDEAGKLELVQEISPGNLEKTLSWRDGMLIFDNDSLDTVVTEISRYTPIRLVISDSSIREMRFGGFFKVGDISAILATLQQDFGIQVDEIEEGLVYLSAAKDSL